MITHTHTHTLSAVLVPQINSQIWEQRRKKTHLEIEICCVCVARNILYTFMQTCNPSSSVVRLSFWLNTVMIKQQFIKLNVKCLSCTGTHHFNLLAKHSCLCTCVKHVSGLVLCVSAEFTKKGHSNNEGENRMSLCPCSCCKKICF